MKLTKLLLLFLTTQSAHPKEQHLESLKDLTPADLRDRTEQER